MFLRFSPWAIVLVALFALTLYYGPIVPVLWLLGLLIFGVYRAATRAKRQPWMHAGLPVLAFALVMLAPVLAFAADSAPETVAQATSETNKVVWAWGATVSEIAGAAASILFGLGMVALRKLPANLIAVFGNARAETLLKNAIDYGVNAVAGAVKGKKLEVNVGNAVLREALQYGVDNAPAWLLSWVGGPENLAKKIWARLDLHETADASALPAIVDSVKPSA